MLLSLSVHCYTWSDNIVSLFKKQEITNKNQLPVKVMEMKRWWSEAVVLGWLHMLSKEIIFQKTTCKLRNSWSPLDKSLINAKGLLYVRMVSARRRCGNKLDVIIDGAGGSPVFHMMEEKFHTQVGAHWIRPWKKGAWALWYIMAGRIFYLNGTDEDQIFQLTEVEYENQASNIASGEIHIGLHLTFTE